MKGLTDILEGLLTSKDVNIDTFKSHTSAILYKLMEDYVNDKSDYRKTLDNLKLHLRPKINTRLTGFVAVPQKDDHIYISFTWTATRVNELEVIEVWYNDTVYVICWDKLMGMFGKKNHVNSFELDVASWMDLLMKDADSHGKFKISRVMYDMGNAKHDKAASEILKAIESDRVDKI